MQVSAWGLKSARVWSRYASARYGDGNCGDSGTFSSLWFSQTPADLKAHPCIAYQFADGAYTSGNSIRMIKKSLIALKGMGPIRQLYGSRSRPAGPRIAYVPVELVADDLEHGKLIRVCSVTACEWRDCFSITLIATSPRPADGH